MLARVQGELPVEIVKLKETLVELYLDENALTQLYGGRDSDGSDAQSSALKEALARALSARDSETARADSEASKRQNASSKAEERIVSLELKLRDARRDADGAPEALAANQKNAAEKVAHPIILGDKHQQCEEAEYARGLQGIFESPNVDEHHH